MQENNDIKKIAFIFPGQGSQYVGMGKEIYESYEEARNLFDKASKILELDLANLCFNSTEEDLAQTKNTQIALFVTEMAITEALKKEGIRADYTAGLSLGEYSSLCYANMLSFEDAVSLVRKRGIYMNDYIEKGNYGMAAVIGLENDIVERICREQSGFLVPVNYNCPGQIVISGEKDSLEQATTKLEQAGARKVIKLNLTSPFHTIKLEKAKELLLKELENICFSNTECIVCKNIDGEKYTNKDDVKQILANHIVSPVYFSKCIENMINGGVTTFIEVGPNKTLSGFVKKVSKDVEVFQIEKLEDLKGGIKK